MLDIFYQENIQLLMHLEMFDFLTTRLTGGL